MDELNLGLATIQRDSKYPIACAPVYSRARSIQPEFRPVRPGKEYKTHLYWIDVSGKKIRFTSAH